MDWSKVRQAVGTIAPWLAGTLGTPVAGVAVKALCDVFGLSGASATPENVQTALAAATPAQLQDLRAANDRHAEFMAQIGYNSLDLFNKDRDSARDREQIVRDHTPQVLAGVAVVAFFAVVLLIVCGFQPAEAMRDGFWMLVGAVVALAKDVYGYYFGSSTGSAKKDETIKGLAQ